MTDWIAARKEWKQGGMLVAAAAITQGVAITQFYTLGVFMKPLSQLYGWSRADIGFIQLIYSVTFAVLGPFVAVFADRLGPRRISIPGVAAFCMTFALYAATTSNIWTWYAVGLLNALTILFCNAPILTLGVARRFKASLGLALAVVLAGGSLYTTTLLPLLAAHMIDHYGVKAAYLTLAALGAGLSLPMLYFFYDRTPVRQPDRTAAPEDGSPVRDTAAGLPGCTVAEAFRQPRYWRLVLATVLITGAVHPAVIHFVPIASDQGLSLETAALAASVIGIASIGGRLFTGVLLDLFPPRLVGAACCILPIGAFALLAHGGSLPLMVAAALIAGLSLGAEIDVASYLTTRYFGIRRYAVIYSVLYSVSSLGSAGGIWLAGRIHDKTGSYHQGMLLCSAVASISALLLLSMGRMPGYSGSDAADDRSGSPDRAGRAHTDTVGVRAIS